MENPVVKVSYLGLASSGTWSGERVIDIISWWIQLPLWAIEDFLGLWLFPGISYYWNTYWNWWNALDPVDRMWPVLLGMFITIIVANFAFLVVNTLIIIMAFYVSNS